MIPAALSLWNSLSDRQREVVRRIAAGQRNKEIAAALSIALPTVKEHVSKAMTKAGCRSRTQLTSWYNADVVPHLPTPKIELPAIHAVNVRLSDRVGRRPEIDAQMRAEGIFYSLAVQSCVELAEPQPEGWRPSNTRVTQGEVHLHPKVSAIVEASPADYIGPDKCVLTNAITDLSDSPFLELYLARFPSDYIFVSHVRFDECRTALGGFLPLFALERSPIPGMLVVHLILETRDGWLVLGQRSEVPRYYKGRWSLSAEEQMNAATDELNPFVTALRGLREELVGHAEMEAGRLIYKGGDFTIEQDDIVFLSVFREFDRAWSSEYGRDVPILNNGVVAYTRLPFILNEVWEHWLDTRTRDRAEFVNLVGIRADFETLVAVLNSAEFRPDDYESNAIRAHSSTSLDYLYSDQRRRQWHPSTKIRVATYLRHKWPDRLVKYLHLA